MKESQKEGEDMSNTRSVSVRIPIEDLNWLQQCDDRPLATQIKLAIQFYIDNVLAKGSISSISSELGTLLITVSEAAKKLGISPRAVRKKIAKGQLAAIKPGNRWLIFANQIPNLLHPNIETVDLTKLKNNGANK